MPAAGSVIPTANDAFPAASLKIIDPDHVAAKRTFRDDPISGIKVLRNRMNLDGEGLHEASAHSCNADP